MPKHWITIFSKKAVGFFQRTPTPRSWTRTTWLKGFLPRVWRLWVMRMSDASTWSQKVHSSTIFKKKKKKNSYYSAFKKKNLNILLLYCYYFVYSYINNSMAVHWISETDYCKTTKPQCVNFSNFSKIFTSTTLEPRRTTIQSELWLRNQGPNQKPKG